MAHTITARYKLDIANTFLNGRPFYICATEVNTGQAHYIKSTSANFNNAIRASTVLPLIYRDFPQVNGYAMTDGGVADGIPVAEVIRLGATHIMVVRSRHNNYVKIDTMWHRFIRWKLSNYPALNQTMRERVSKFNDTIRLIRNPPCNVEILEICPSEEFTIGRFCRNHEKLKHGYVEGKSCADTVITEWQQQQKRRSKMVKTQPES